MHTHIYIYIYYVCEYGCVYMCPCVHAYVFILERPVASLYCGFCQTLKSLKSILEPVLQILETIFGNLSCKSVCDVMRQAGTQYMLLPATSHHTHK